MKRSMQHAVYYLHSSFFKETRGDDDDIRENTDKQRERERETERKKERKKDKKIYIYVKTSLFSMTQQTELKLKKKINEEFPFSSG